MHPVFAHRLRLYLLTTILFATTLPPAQAQTIPVRHVQGTLHGFLELRSGENRIVASGDNLQTVHGDEVTSRTIFHFRDGSVDDETVVYSQRRTLRIISDRRVQKGPFFPHPMDVALDARTGQVTVRSLDKDGKEQVTVDHLDLPADLSNGMIPAVIENLPADSPGATVSMLVATPKPRLVKLVISRVGDQTFFVGGTPRKAIHHQIKIELGGIAGVVAPLIAKAPPDVQIWSVGGEAPGFVREVGPLYPDGPLMTIQLAGPVWPDSSGIHR